MVQETSEADRGITFTGPSGQVSAGPAGATAAATSVGPLRLPSVWTRLSAGFLLLVADSGILLGAWARASIAFWLLGERRWGPGSGPAVRLDACWLSALGGARSQPFYVGSACACVCVCVCLLLGRIFAGT